MTTDYNYDSSYFQARYPTVVVHNRNRFMGTGRIKTLPCGKKVIAGFKGIYPSRDPSDTYKVLDIIEDQIFNQEVEHGSVMFDNASLSWHVE
jgi:hypothetical protein